MRRPAGAWLSSRLGINFVAVGLVAAVVAIPVILTQDIWFLVTGVWPKLPWYREGLYDLLVLVAAVFAVGSFFIFRPGLPKFAAIVIAISFLSYIVRPFIPIRASQQLTLLCIARILGFSTLLLLVWTYFSDLKGGRVVE